MNIKIGISANGEVIVTSSSKNKREHKGKATNKHIDDYCVVDLETTSRFVTDAEIIEISAIKVVNNIVVSEYSTLINPGCEIPEEATLVNHITDEMVKDAPLLEEVIDEFLEFVGDDVVLGYNIAGFDLNIIYDKVAELRGKYFTNDYLDILHAVRRSLPQLPNAKLETASKYYGFDTTGEHRALKDCYLTKDCYDKLTEEFGDIAFKSSSHNSSGGHSIKYSYETLALRELMKLLEGILADGVVTLEEVEILRYWVEEHKDLSGSYPFDKAFDALDTVLDDGIVTDEELKDLKMIFEEIIDPVKNNGCHEKITSLVEKHVCITGNFDFGSRSDVEDLIKKAGGILDKGVKKATDYVLVGSQGSDAWKTGNYGGKIQKAIELKEKGQNIKILEEKEFIPVIQSIILESDQ